MKNKKPEILNAFEKVVDSGWLVLGPNVKQFEQSFAQYLGAAYCISLANGTDAIELALKAFGVDTARVTRDQETFLLAENESTFIPVSTKHRLENPGTIPLEMIEVQSGSYLGKTTSSGLTIITVARQFMN